MSFKIFVIPSVRGSCRPRLTRSPPSPLLPCARARSLLRPKRKPRTPIGGSFGGFPRRALAPVRSVVAVATPESSIVLFE
eukprot:9868428-Lingulodinium_polyedra.AAC.1